MWEFKRQHNNQGLPLNVYHVFEPPGSDRPVGVFVFMYNTAENDMVGDFMRYTPDEVAAEASDAYMAGCQDHDS